MHVGLIGVGMMGHGMAVNLLQHGHALSVIAHRNRQPVDDQNSTAEWAACKRYDRVPG